MKSEKDEVGVIGNERRGGYAEMGREGQGKEWRVVRLKWNIEEDNLTKCRIDDS